MQSICASPLNAYLREKVILNRNCKMQFKNRRKAHEFICSKRKMSFDDSYGHLIYGNL